MRGGVETIEGMPVQWVAPGAARGVALWLTHPGGSTEQAALMLTRLAERLEHLEAARDERLYAAALDRLAPGA